METQGNCSKFLHGKHTKWVDNLLHCEIFMLLRWEIFLHREHINNAMCMSTIWKNFHTLSSHLLQENFLPADNLTEFD
jgi:hypothetical protein